MPINVRFKSNCFRIKSVPPRPYEIYLKLPGFDCGACDAPSCLTFARRLAARRASLDLCPFSESRGEVERIAAAAEFPRPISDRNLSLIKPCVNDSAKVMGEVQLVLADGEKPLFGFFDIITMRYLLGLRYPDLKFSFKLGSAKLQLEDGSKALVFENGYISIREVSSAEALIRNVDYLARMLWGAAICPRCAAPVLECRCTGRALVRPAIADGKKESICEAAAINVFSELKQFDLLLKEQNSSSRAALRDRAINSLLDRLLEREGAGAQAIWLISLLMSLYRAVEAKSQAGEEPQLLLQRAWDLVRNFDRYEQEALLMESEKCRSRILEQIRSTRNKDLVRSLVVANSACFIARSFLKLLSG